jgi:soluble lytic murein transglycosylase-like protein
MVSITNYPNTKTPGSLSGIPKNLAHRVSQARNSRFQKILAAFETRSSKNFYKSRGLTIADYRARAVIPKSRYRRQPQPADAELKNTTFRSRFKASDQVQGSRPKRDYMSDLNRLRFASSAPPRPDHKIIDKDTVETLLNKTGSQPVTLTDQQIIKDTIQKAAAKYNLPPELITAVIRAESNFEVSAVSSAGARGLMQLMPATAKELGVKNPFDIEENINGGTKYLRNMLDRFGGSVRKALAAYNAGPGTVMKYNGRVPYPETRQYVKRVLRFSRQIT